ncbi:teneurin-3-like isoform X1 [Patiria miniata]|uniref:EGF-like domain-containing protein n=2 Tax=Patiria miniata TaxID=46514 RepID=A0A913ZZL9_PATMI|nr:teneurin-3-like isoform X1 [Patiria miniata]XP_038057023.1 teneurin-3-like isoform X1 [Patiria miniata]
MATSTLDSTGHSDYLTAICPQPPCQSQPQPRPTTTCSTSSVEEDSRDRGYGSNEALRAYEREIRRGLERVPSSAMDEAETASYHSLTSQGEETRVPYARPPSCGSDVDGDTESVTGTCADKLIREADNFLQSADGNSAGSESSSGSSLTLTETEQEQESPRNTPARKRGIRGKHKGKGHKSAKQPQEPPPAAEPPIPMQPVYPPQHPSDPNVDSTDARIHPHAQPFHPAVNVNYTPTPHSNGMGIPPYYHTLERSEGEQETTFHGNNSMPATNVITNPMLGMTMISSTMPSRAVPAIPSSPNTNMTGGSRMNNFQPRRDDSLMSPHPYSTINSSRQNTATRGFYEFPNNGTSSTLPPVPGFTALYNDKRPNSNTQQLKYRRVAHTKQGLKSWKCAALLLAVISFALAATVIYLAVVSISVNQCRVETVENILTDCKSTAVVPSTQGLTATTKRPTTAAPTQPQPTQPSAIALNAPSRVLIPPGDFWVSALPINTQQYVQLNLTIPLRSNFAIFGQRRAPPTHTEYDFVRVHAGSRWHDTQRGKRDVHDERKQFVLDGRKGRKHHDVIIKEDFLKGFDRSRRSSVLPDTTLSFIEEMVPGLWFVGVYNDGEATEEVALEVSDRDTWDDGQRCPRGCSGHGECVLGQCVCDQAYIGEDCSQGICPVLCSGHGRYAHGVCECFSNWKGPECSVRSEQCLVPDCSGHGQCVLGECVCSRGYIGQACEEEVHECGNNTDCGIHGQCDTGMCRCEKGWTGEHCSQEASCLLPCSPRGRCVDDSCVCELGWNGRLCGLEGCPDGCNTHGDCQFVDMRWQCVCTGPHRGKACEITMETACSDGQDNDGDTLMDCLDPDCCHDDFCASSILCTTSPDPGTILGRDAMSLVTPPLSFYDRYKFLVEADSVQTGAMLDDVDPSHVAVIHGRLVGEDDGPITGARVHVEIQPSLGYTYTRQDGMYDLMVLGGGSIRLILERQPYHQATKYIYIPLQSFIHVDDITMSATSSTAADSNIFSSHHAAVCAGEDFPVPEFKKISAVGSEEGTCREEGFSVDQRAIHEQVPISGTKLTLDYFSQSGPGQPSMLALKLTPPSLPQSLEMVHVSVSLEGRRFQDTLMPEEGMEYTLRWDGRNVYGQTVYGRAIAIVSVGYEYQGCDDIIWRKQRIAIDAPDWGSMDLGGWQLPVHHNYNPEKAILSLGTGQRVFYHHQPATIQSIMGNGRQRNEDCSQCAGRAKNNRMLAPIALASSPQGDVYVGDSNFVRRIDKYGNATNVLQLRYQPSYKYYLAVSPLTGVLYLSDGQTRQIYQIRKLANIPNVSSNLMLVAGTGTPCQPLDPDGCGDGGSATDAKLLDPKGIAVGRDGTIYFVDGTVVRKIQDGIITTVVGSHTWVGPTRLPKCSDSMSFDQVKLQWPTDIAINPIDDSIYVTDETVILRLGKDGLASVFAGVPPNCPFDGAPQLGPSDEDHMISGVQSGPKLATQEQLMLPSALAFSSTGELFVAETDNLHLHRVRRITTDGIISWYAGRDSECDCREEECICFDQDQLFAVDANLNTPVALTVTPDNDLIIADQRNLRIRKVTLDIPKLDEEGHYLLASPDRREIYRFDQRGFHQTTWDTLTQLASRNLSYDGNMKLRSVSDGPGNDLRIIRDDNGSPLRLLPSSGDIVELTLNSQGLLTGTANGDGSQVTRLEYHDSGEGLLMAKYSGNVLQHVYEYNKQGLLETVTWPTGEVTKLRSRTNDSHSIVEMTEPGRADFISSTLQHTWLTEQTLLQADLMATIIQSRHDGQFSLSYPNGVTVQLQRDSHPVYEDDPYAVMTKRKIVLPEDLVNRLDWRYYGRRGGQDRRKILVIGRKLRINGEHVFTLEYNRFTKTETLQNADGIPILIITHDATGLPIEWLPTHGLKPTNATYDPLGRLIRWQRGLMFEAFSYDIEGRLVGRRHGNDSMWNFAYERAVQPSQTTVPNGQHYAMLYDNSGNLKMVTMPTGARHRIRTVISLGYTRNIYSSEDNAPWVMQDLSQSGHLLQTYFPGTGRRTTYIYDNKDRMADVLFEETAVEYSYHSNTDQVKTIELQEGRFHNSMRFVHNGPLVEQMLVRTTGFEGLMNARYDYVYDATFRAATISAEFNTTVLPLKEMRFDSETGRVEQMGFFTVTYPDAVTQIMADSFFQLRKQYGTYALLQEVSYQITGVGTIASMSLLYHLTGRMAQRVLTMPNESHTTKYFFDVNGQLEEVTVDDRLMWKYTYDNNGNIASLSHQGSIETLDYDDQDRITRVGTTDYRMDSDGFLTQRGEEIFEYNSNCLLVHAYKPHVYDIRYKYDGVGRRIWRKDHTGRQVQFFYGDITKPTRVTHIYDHMAREMTSLEYDLQGFLFAIRRGQTQLYVASNHVGSPIAVFNANGEILKRLTLDPLGKVLSDSDPTFLLHIGFQGGIYDSLTRLVHFDRRDYDPICGRWTSPDLNFFKDITQTSRTKAFNMYTFNGNIFVGSDTESHYLSDLWSWFPVLGYDINNMIPQLNRNGQIETIDSQRSAWKDSTVMTSWAKPCTALDCQGSLHMDMMYTNFHALPIDHFARDSKTYTPPPVKFTSSPALIGGSVLLTLNRDKIDVEVFGAIGETTEKLVSIVTGAEILEKLRHTQDGRDVQYFVKSNDAEDDLDALDLIPEVASLNMILNDGRMVVAARSSPQANATIITLRTEYIAWNFMYGITSDAARTMVLAQAKDVAIAQAWQKEKVNILNNRRGTINWTAVEKAAILQNGFLPTYEGQYTLDPTVFPEMAFDGNAIRLVRVPQNLQT